MMMRRNSSWIMLLAAWLLLAAAPLHAFLVSPINEELVAVELETTGESREEALQQAVVDAVRGTAGRIFLTDQLILADDLLAKYLGNYADNFVSAVEVLNEEFVAGQNRVKARVFVNYGQLVQDMQEKRFLYKPALRPQFTTFMTERLDGQIVTEGQARTGLAETLNRLGMRNYGADIGTPPANTAVADDDFLLDAAIVSSQRAGVEVIVSGTSRTVLEEKRSLYYDTFWFYQTEMEVKLIRVDTGEELFAATGKGSASARDQDESISLSISRASEEVAQKLIPDFSGYWPLVVQQESNFEVLLTGVDEELVRVVATQIERLGRDTEVTVRKSFDRTTIISVMTPASKQDLLGALNACPYPTLNTLNPSAERVFEVQVTD